MSHKIPTLMFLVFFSITFISAIPIYSGESIEMELEKPFEYYSIVGNSTEVTLDIIQDGNFVTITPDKYSLNDSYEIIFFDINKEIIVNHYSGGGGGTRTIYKDKNVTQYVDKEIKVPGETITKEVEKQIIKTSLLSWILVIILFGIVLYLVFSKRDKSERRYENNE